MTRALPQKLRRVGGPFLVPALGALALAALVVHADRDVARGVGVLGALRAPVDALVWLGGWLHEEAGPTLLPLRVPALLALGGALGWLQLRARGAAAAGWIALGLGWIAQSYLLELRYGPGLALYAGSIAVYLSRRDTPEADRAPTRVAGSRWIALSLMLAFALLALVRLDLYPELFLDEVAYLVTSRMQLGELPVGDIFPGPEWKAFSLTRFQAQPVPLLLFSLAVYLAAPGVLALRLVSFGACALALGVALAVLRRRLGDVVTIAMLALCVFSPLWLAFARIGHYLSVSILHGAICFALLLRLQERWDRGSALLLGLLLGSSLYLYQLSWFVPLLAAIALVVSPELWRSAQARRSTALAGGAAIVVLLPGLLLFPQGLREMGDQSLALARWTEWREPTPDDLRVAQLLAPRELDRDAAASLGAELELGAVRSVVASSRSDRQVLTLVGPPAAIEAALARPPLEPWPRLLDTGPAASPLRDLAQLLRQLFVSAGWQQRGHLFQGGRLVDAPLIDPVVVPLLVLGIVEALRRRREPLMRTLLVWVIVGGTLPAVLTGVLPRRIVLALPFLQVVMALPIGVLCTALVRNARASESRSSRIAIAAFSTLAIVCVAATGAHLYFRHWDGLTSAALASGSKLELATVIRELPDDGPILLPPIYPLFDGFLRRVAEEPPMSEPRRVFTIASAEPEAIRNASCRQAVPFHWIHRDDAESRERFRALERWFELDERQRGAFRVIRVESRRPGACAELPSPPG